MRTSAWIYPWDVSDLGVPEWLRHLGPAGLKEVHVATSYHSLFATVPDNPKRHLVDLRRSAVYHRPDPAAWESSPLKPRVSDFVAASGDALELGRTLASALGCALSAWVVCLHNDLGVLDPSVSVETVWGDRVRGALCLNHPSVRAYARALVADIGARADRLQLESAHWMPVPHQLHNKLAVGAPSDIATLAGLCFCQHCRAGAAAFGIDVAGLAAELRRRWDDAVRGPGDAAPTGSDQVQRFLRFRTASVTTLIADLAAHSPVPLEVVSFGDRSVTGVDLGAIESTGAVTRALAYGSEATVIAAVEQLRTAADAPRELNLGLSLLPEHTADRDELRTSVSHLERAGVHAAAFYHLGLVDDERRGWIGQVTRG